jgi:hypothetical protein
VVGQEIDSYNKQLAEIDIKDRTHDATPGGDPSNQSSLLKANNALKSAIHQ